MSFFHYIEQKCSTLKYILRLIMQSELPLLLRSARLPHEVTRTPLLRNVRLSQGATPTLPPLLRSARFSHEATPPPPLLRDFPYEASSTSRQVASREK